jgi:hypothetical protein
MVLSMRALVRHRVGLSVKVRRASGFAALRQPAPHERHFGILGLSDTLAEALNRTAIGAAVDQGVHGHRLGVVDNHMLHESRIGGGVRAAAHIDRMLRRDGSARLAGRSGILNRRR